MRALAAAAQAALAVNATTTAAVAEALVAAENSAAGMPSRSVTLLWSEMCSPCLKAQQVFAEDPDVCVSLFVILHNVPTSKIVTSINNRCLS